MAAVTVWGHVPVAVIVDTETGEVTRVVAVDEEFRVDADSPPTDDGNLRPAVAADADAALAVVNADDAEWPMWEFGF
ncbi:MAG: hypothetical protein M3256_24125 [Actinomycetota bacterium]|nr:hypothetical protein [Actinomycetota bacterium]